MKALNLLKKSRGGAKQIFTIKNIFYLTASFLVTVVVMGFLFKIVSVEEVTSLIRNMDMAPAVCFILLSLAQTWIQAWRYSLLLTACRVHLSIPVLFLVTTARNLFSDLLPARLGTLSYVLILTGKLDVRMDKALSGFALAFVFDILAICPLVVLSLLASRTALYAELHVILPFILLLGLGFWIILRHLSRIFRLAGAVLRHLGPLKKTAGPLEDTARQVDDIGKSGVYVHVFILSLTGRILKYGKLFFLLFALLSSQGYGWRDIGLARFFLGVSGAEFAASLPVSGIAAFGAYEGAWALIFSILGFPKQLAVSTGISHHLITQVYGYALGVTALVFLMIPGIGKSKVLPEKSLSRIGFLVRLSLFLAFTGSMLFLPFSVGSDTVHKQNENQIQRKSPSPGSSAHFKTVLEPEKKALEELNNKIKGRIVFTKLGRIFRQEIGERTPRELGEGDYARWEFSGKRLAVYHKGGIFVMKADGTGKRKLLQVPDKAKNCPIEFHTNGKEILFINPGKGLWAVNIDDGKVRPVETSRKFDGEPGISSKGDRIALRHGHRLFAIDLGKRLVMQYGRGCSPGVSPDGTRLMQNRDGHREMLIRNFEGGGIIKLDAKTCQPDGKWDNQHWSNHDDYIAAQGNGDVKEAYVVSVSTKRGYRITWTGGVQYPDLFVRTNGDP